MQEILNDLQATAKRCSDVAKAVYDELEDAGLGFLWGFIQMISDSSVRTLPQGYSNTSIQGAEPQSHKTQVFNEKRNRFAINDANIGSSTPKKRSDGQSALTNSMQQPPLAEFLKNVRSPPRGLEAFKSVLVNAEHPLIQAAYEANRIVEHTEISIIPKIGVLVEEYHDNAAELHQKKIVKLISKRGEHSRSFDQILVKLMTDTRASTASISTEDRMDLINIALGRGRESAFGLFLACTLLPELGAELSKIANRIDAKISVQAAKREAISPQSNSLKNTHANELEIKFPIKTAISQAVDFIILTAIDVELRAVRKAFGLTEKDRKKIGTRVYWKGSIPINNQESYSIVVAQATDMANPEAALLTSDMIHHWTPSAALFVGIAATAVPVKVSMGDIVVGTEIYYYERLKETRKGARHEPKSIPADSMLLNNIRSMDWANDVSAPRPDNANKKPQVHFGVIGCGEKVIAYAKKRDGLTKANRRVLAIEMEGYGFSLAACQSFEKVRHLDIRGICDDASENKDDSWHEYAAAAAATFAKDFLLDRPLEPRDSRAGSSP